MLKLVVGTAVVGCLATAFASASPSRSVTVPWDDSDYPAWSPDNTQIAFSSDRPFAGKGIFLMATDGTNERVLTSPGFDDGETGMRAETPAWSPDGKRVAFVWVSFGPDGSFNPGIYVARSNQRPDSPDERYVGRGVCPSWSPDGRRLAVAVQSITASEAPSGIDVMNADGTDVEQISAGPGDLCPDWGSGDEIAYQHNGAIDVIKPDGSGNRLVIPNGSSPSWSPDGKRIAFLRNTRPTASRPTYRVFLANADGTNVRQLTSGPATVWDIRADWSPDGHQLVWARCENGRCWIFTINDDGSALRRLTPDRPAFCRVPVVRGKRLAQAIRALRAAGCTRGHTRTKHSRRVASGRVIAQNPRAGAFKPGGSKVRLLISLGR